MSSTAARSSASVIFTLRVEGGALGGLRRLRLCGRPRMYRGKVRTVMAEPEPEPESERESQAALASPRWSIRSSLHGPDDALDRDLRPRNLDSAAGDRGVAHR